ncbi:hypothetical protein ACJX0J_038863, partial [Zea mays]
FSLYDILKEDPRRYFGFLLSILIIAAGALNIGDLFLQSTHEYLSERLRSLMPLFRYYSMTELLQHYGRNRKRICGIHLGGDLLDPIPGGGEAHRRVPNLHSTFRNMTEIYSTITENHHLLVKMLYIIFQMTSSELCHFFTFLAQHFVVDLLHMMQIIFTNEYSLSLFAFYKVITIYLNYFSHLFGWIFILQVAQVSISNILDTNCFIIFLIHVPIQELSHFMLFNANKVMFIPPTSTRIQELSFDNKRQEFFIAKKQYCYLVVLPIAYSAG